MLIIISSLNNQVKNEKLIAISVAGTLNQIFLVFVQIKCIITLEIPTTQI